MSTANESVCCHEIDKAMSKMQEGEDTVECITDHQGFGPVCLDRWVLQAAYFNYRRHYGTADVHHIPLHE